MNQSEFIRQRKKHFRKEAPPKVLSGEDILRERALKQEEERIKNIQQQDNTLTIRDIANRQRIKKNIPIIKTKPIKFLKQKVKQAVSFLSAFETGLMNETRKRGCDGVVCGHIHKAEIKIIDGLVYANDGDWVESKTALTEDENGIISLINFDEFTYFIKASDRAETDWDDVPENIKDTFEKLGIPEAESSCSREWSAASAPSAASSAPCASTTPA